jgi:hypothetical protein
MATWREFEAEAPELAARAREFLDAGKHKTIATLRQDGAPRISGTEADVVDGELWFGSMWQAVKARDLIRDGRFALHGASTAPPDWAGDAKVAGVAVEVDDGEAKRALLEAGGNEGIDGEWHLFRADVREVVVVGLNEERTKMVIESWHEGRGVSRFER